MASSHDSNGVPDRADSTNFWSRVRNIMNPLRLSWRSATSSGSDGVSQTEINQRLAEQIAAEMRARQAADKRAEEATAEAETARAEAEEARAEAGTARAQAAAEERARLASIDKGFSEHEQAYAERVAAALTEADEALERDLAAMSVSDEERGEILAAHEIRLADSLERDIERFLDADDRSSLEEALHLDRLLRVDLSAFAPRGQSPRLKPENGDEQFMDRIKHRLRTAKTRDDNTAIQQALKDVEKRIARRDDGKHVSATALTEFLEQEREVVGLTRAIKTLRALNRRIESGETDLKGQAGQLERKAGGNVEELIARVKTIEASTGTAPVSFNGVKGNPRPNGPRKPASADQRALRDALSALDEDDPDDAGFGIRRHKTVSETAINKANNGQDPHAPATAKILAARFEDAGIDEDAVRARTPREIEEERWNRVKAAVDDPGNNFATVLGVSIMDKHPEVTEKVRQGAVLLLADIADTEGLGEADVEEIGFVEDAVSFIKLISDDPDFAFDEDRSVLPQVISYLRANELLQYSAFDVLSPDIDDGDDDNLDSAPSPASGRNKGGEQQLRMA